MRSPAIDTQSKTNQGSSSSLSERLFEELSDIARSHGCELVQVEHSGNALRLFLDREGGVTLEHCEKVSRDASAVLDVEDFGRSRYTLEVSSPGLDRKLYRPRDWQRFVGRAVKVTYIDAEAGKRTVTGTLHSFIPDVNKASGTAEILLEHGELLTIPLSDVQTARLRVEL